MAFPAASTLAVALAVPPAVVPACANSPRGPAPSEGNSSRTAAIKEKSIPQQAAAAVPVSGLVDLADGHAFIRTSGYRRSPDDVYVAAGQIRQYGLRKGDLIEGAAQPAVRGKYRPLARVDTINGN